MMFEKSTFCGLSATSPGRTAVGADFFSLASKLSWLLPATETGGLLTERLLPE